MWSKKFGHFLIIGKYIDKLKTGLIIQTLLKGAQK